MKIEKVNENKIKITFNIDDLAEKNIDLYSFMHNTPETQDLFWDILNEAEKECGFNVDNAMIYVEATTSGGGNFVLTVTKTNEKPAINHLKKKNVKLKRKNTSLPLEEAIYEFENFDDICELVKGWDMTNLPNNILYSMNDKYYLKTTTMPSIHVLEYASICLPYQVTEAKLQEYGSIVIAQNALQTVQHFFTKKRRKS